MQQLVPDPIESIRLTAFYRAKALHGFREALARDNFTRSSYDAALVTGLLVVLLASKDVVVSADNMVVLQWVALYKGVGALLMLESPASRQDNCMVCSVFRREYTELESAPVVPKILVSMLALIPLMDPDYQHLKQYCETLDCLGILYASLEQNGISPDLYLRVLSWPSRLSPEFGSLCQERRPRAMIILAYYLAFVKLVKGLWWVEGLAEREIKIIASMVGPEWAFVMEVPNQVAEMSYSDDVVRLLLK